MVFNGSVGVVFVVCGFLLRPFAASFISFGCRQFVLCFSFSCLARVRLARNVFAEHIFLERLFSLIVPLSHLLRL